MACMRVTVVGCAGSFPGPDSPASCYLLEAEGFRLVIDLGNGALGVLQRYAELFGIDAICVSHLHADHCVDLGAYWVARQYAAGRAEAAHPGARPARDRRTGQRRLRRRGRWRRSGPVRVPRPRARARSRSGRSGSLPIA